MQTKELDWIYSLQNKYSKEAFDIENFKTSLLKELFNVIQDGISIEDPDLNILYCNPSMRRWYKDNDGEKCYQRYHCKKQPCKNCPVKRSLKTGKLEASAASYDVGKKNEGMQYLYALPLYDSDKKIICIIEYVRDVSKECKAELSVELLQRQNEILQQYLLEKEEQEIEIYQTISKNLNESIKPVLDYLNKILEKDLFDMISRQLTFSKEYLLRNNISKLSQLTEQELTVINFIKAGYTSKEIAQKLNITTKAVDYHRNKIRKDLDISPKVSLKKYLINLP